MNWEALLRTTESKACWICSFQGPRSTQTKITKPLKLKMPYWYSWNIKPSSHDRSTQTIIHESLWAIRHRYPQRLEMAPHLYSCTGTEMLQGWCCQPNHRNGGGMLEKVDPSLGFFQKEMAKPFPSSLLYSPDLPKNSHAWRSNRWSQWDCQGQDSHRHPRDTFPYLTLLFFLPWQFNVSDLMGWPHNLMG